MKIIGFVGSPRKNGNTDVLVQKVLDSASESGAEAKIYYLNELNIKSCQGCDACKVNDGCRLQDDMTALYDQIADADGIVLGSPVYMSYVSGQVKVFLDRCYALLNSDYTSKLKNDKKTILVFTQGDPDPERYGQTFASLAETLCSGGFEVLDTLVGAGFKEAGAVANDQELMKKAQKAGEKLAKVCKMAQIFKKPDVVSGPSKAKRK